MIPTTSVSARAWAVACALAMTVLAAVGIPGWLLAPTLAGRIVMLAIALAGGLWTLHMFTRTVRRRRKALRRPFPPEWQHILTQRVAFYTQLDEDNRDRFEKLMSVFLADVPIRGVDCDIDDTVRVLVAASAVIPVFGFPQWEYSSLSEVVVYPKSFDSGFGYDEDRTPSTLGLVGGAGSAFSGLMVLSRPDLLKGFEIHGDKHNVGVHEFAHLVDQADGSIDGLPAGLPPDAVGPWTKLVSQQLEKYREDGNSDIPAYGFTNEQEFLAVATEYFFESPRTMQRKHPELYDLLERAYRQDTRSLLGNIKRKLFQPGRRKVGRNAPCPCGSGKKYKKCCLRKAKKRRRMRNR